MKVYKNSAYKNKFHFYIPTMKGSYRNFKSLMKKNDLGNGKTVYHPRIIIIKYNN